MRRIAGVVLAVTVVGLAGCSGGGSSGDADALDTCVQALDAADQGFNELAANVRVVQEALRQAFAGDVSAAEATLGQVSQTDPSRYKQFEADCRDAAK